MRELAKGLGRRLERECSARSGPLDEAKRAKTRHVAGGAARMSRDKIIKDIWWRLLAMRILT